MGATKTLKYLVTIEVDVCHDDEGPAARAVTADVLAELNHQLPPFLGGVQFEHPRKTRSWIGGCRALSARALLETTRDKKKGKRRDQ